MNAMKYISKSLVCLLVSGLYAVSGMAQDYDASFKSGRPIPTYGSFKFEQDKDNNFTAQGFKCGSTGNYAAWIMNTDDRISAVSFVCYVNTSSAPNIGYKFSEDYGATWTTDKVVDVTGKTSYTVTIPASEIPANANAIMAYRSKGTSSYIESIHVSVIPKSAYTSATVNVGGVDYAADVMKSDMVHFLVPYSSDITSLIPSFTLMPSATYKDLSQQTTPADFTSSVTTPIVYTFTLGGVDYPVKVTVEKMPASTRNAVLGYEYTYTVGGTKTTRNAVVDTVAGTVKVTLPYSMKSGEDNYAVSQSISTKFWWAPLAVYDNGMGGAVTADTCVGNVDYTASNSFVVTSESGVSKTYTVQVAYDEPEQGCSILGFALYDGDEKLDQTIGIDQENGVINITVGDEDLDALTPKIVLSKMAKVSPKSEVVQNFESDKTYTVTSESGLHTKTYTVHVTQDKVKPVMTVKKPANNSEGASLAGKIIVGFSEECKRGESSKKVTISGPGKSNEDLSATLVMGSDTTFSFSGLSSLSDYTVTFEKGFFVDLYGNEQDKVTLKFKTADAVLHGPYVSYMDGADFEQPAFIQGVNYNESISTRAATVNKTGAYEVPVGGTLTVTIENAMAMDLIVYCLGNSGSYSLEDGGGNLIDSYTFTQYENKGHEGQNIAAPAGTITLRNTGTETLYVPFVSFTNGTTGTTDSAAHCK